MSRFAGALISQIILIFLLGVVAGFPWPDFSDSNWQTVLFLTPSGIISNHLHWTLLRDFYAEPTKGQIQLSARQITGISVLWLGLVANFVWVFRHRRRP